MKRVALRGLLDEKDAITVQAKAAMNERVADMDVEVCHWLPLPATPHFATALLPAPPCLHRVAAGNLRGGSAI